MLHQQLQWEFQSLPGLVLLGLVRRGENDLALGAFCGVMEAENRLKGCEMQE